METLFGDMPYFCLLWMGVGFIFLIIGIFMLAHKTEKEMNYTENLQTNQKDQSPHKLEELFSFFLQEEEKKNQALRESLIEVQSDKPNVKNLEKNVEVEKIEKDNEEEKFNEIVRLYEQNMSIEEIAKQLKMGIGEVKLIISLYAMR